jgi:hypothetical protein
MNTKDTNITNEEFRRLLDEKILPHIRNILLEKNKKYKGASFEGGIYALIGNRFRQQDKMNRYKYLIDSYIENGKWDDPFGESIFDTVRDQAGYAIIGLTILTLLDIGPLVETNDELWSKFEKMKKETEEIGIQPSEPWSHPVQKDNSNLTKPLDQVQQLKNAIENVFLSNMDRPEVFASIVWKSIVEELKAVAPKNYLQEVSDILFLREDIDTQKPVKDDGTISIPRHTLERWAKTEQSRVRESEIRSYL